MIIGCDYYTGVEWIGVGYNKPGDWLLSVGKIGHGDAASRVESFQRLGLPVRFVVCTRLQRTLHLSRFELVSCITERSTRGVCHCCRLN